MKVLASFERELALSAQGVQCIVGIDEVGRGPIAGPVVAAAVVLNPLAVPVGLADSKQISERTRHQLYGEILASAHVGIACVSAREIDRINIRQATLAAMSRAFHALPLSELPVKTFALVDGNDPPPLPCTVETIIKGDAHIASIAAASIVAKVTRDRIMQRLCATYPAYGFSRHVGYPTPAHKAALMEHGPCPFHRFSFAPLRLNG
ncbi:ribonuclease HII [Pseudochelatococcus sp. G4_1912]|uniref:ribonuclease HII n=1 Tax=Pseudochelatococcus sp. G4_1912 TaxID=3114288 RepID=UPI0039C5D33D